MKKKRRNKPYRPRPVHRPHIVSAALTFGPLYTIIDQIERDGTVTTNRAGVAMFQDSTGGWYDTAKALEGIIQHCEMWCTRHRRTLPLDSLSEFQRLIKYTMNVPQSLVDRLRRDLPRVQAAMARANPDDLNDLVTQVKISDELERSQ